MATSDASSNKSGENSCSARRVRPGGRRPWRSSRGALRGVRTRCSEACVTRNLSNVFDVSLTRECKKCPRITPTSLVEARFARTVALPRDSRRTHARRHLEGVLEHVPPRRRSYPSRAAFAGYRLESGATMIHGATAAACPVAVAPFVRRARARVPARAARGAPPRPGARRPSPRRPELRTRRTPRRRWPPQSQRTRAGAPRSPACGRAFLMRVPKRPLRTTSSRPV